MYHPICKYGFLAVMILHSLLCAQNGAANGERKEIKRSKRSRVCVYGGTTSGIMAAVGAAHEGHTVIIVEPSRWISASHIAMTSLRMEPVWMILGESAGIAASITLRDTLPVQDIDYQLLKNKLIEVREKLTVPLNIPESMN